MIKTLRHGFEWGQVKVMRYCEITRANGVYRVLRVNDLEIYVSPTGKATRVFRDGKELTVYAPAESRT